MKRELRFMPARELRVVEEDGKPLIRGYAAVYEQRSEVLWDFREVIARGAFREAIARDDVRCLWNHNSDAVLGRNRAGTLQLIEDEVGLSIRCVPPDTTWGRDAVESIRRGDVDGMSFGFTIADNADVRWETAADGSLLRTVVRCGLFDVSPCTFPAYPQTSVGLRSLGYEPPEDMEEQSRRLRAAADGANAGALRDKLRSQSLDIIGWR